MEKKYYSLFANYLADKMPKVKAYSMSLAPYHRWLQLLIKKQACHYDQKEKQKELKGSKAT